MILSCMYLLQKLQLAGNVLAFDLPALALRTGNWTSLKPGFNLMEEFFNTMVFLGQF